MIRYGILVTMIAVAAAWVAPPKLVSPVKPSRPMKDQPESFASDETDVDVLGVIPRRSGLSVDHYAGGHVSPRGGGFSFTPILDDQQVQDSLITSPPPGVVIDAVSYVGHFQSSALFTGLDWQFGSESIEFPQGVLLSTGVVPPTTNTLGAWSWSTATPGDSDLTSLLGYPTADASAVVIEFTTDEFVDTVSFRLVFGSEEHPEFSGLQYNDGFGAFLDGINIAFDDQGLPITVNSGTLALDNTDDPTAGFTPVNFPIEYDGLTREIQIQAPLTPGPHQLKLVVADGFDRFVDSGVFLSGLEFGFACPGIAPPPTLQNVPEFIEVPVGEQRVVNLFASDANAATTVELTTAPESLPANMVLDVVSGNPAMGTLTFTPDASQLGQSYEVAIVATNSEQACATDSVRFNVTATLDLSLADDDLSVIPNQLFTGDFATIQAIVRNSGAVPAQCQVSFYRGGLPGDGGVLVGVDSGVNVPANGDADAAAAWNTSGIFGEQVLAAVISQINPAMGDDPSNNFAQTVATVDPLADLQVVALTPPPSAQLGTPVDIVWTVTNTGDTAAVGPWSEVIYLSSDPLPGGDTVLATIDIDMDLEVGENQERIETVVLPDLGGAITYWIRVEADPAGEVRELNENNNSLTRAFCTSCLHPDLTVDSITADATAATNQPMSVTWTVLNEGNGQALGSWVDRVYVRSVAGGSDVLVGEFTQSGPIGASPGEYTRTEDVVIPYGNSGDYFVVVRTDATNTLSEPGGELNNEGVSDLTTTVSLAPRPNLVVTSVGDTPATGNFGDTVPISWTVENQGNATAFGVWNDRVYLSTNTVFDAGDTPLSANPQGDTPRDPGQTYDRLLPVTLPTNYTTSGTYYLLVRADSNSTLAESDETDNVLASDPIQLQATQYADLRVSVLNAPAIAYDGQMALVTWTVQNSGTGMAFGGWVDTVSISSNSSGTNATLLNGFVHIGGLAEGATYTTTQAVPIPAGYNGEFYLKVTTDAQGNVSEPGPGGEQNNTKVAQAATTVVQLELPDLQVLDLSGPSTVFTNGTITLSWRDQNLGSGTANGAWVDRVYRSTDAILTLPPGPDVQVKELPVATVLGPGQGFLRTAQITADSTPGNYYYFVVADAADGIEEGAADANNASSIQVLVEAPDYEAVVQTAFEEGLAATSTSSFTIPLSGVATRIADGTPVPNVPVTIRTKVQGTRRVFNVMSNGQGEFQFNFSPLPNEAGQYLIYAGHPAVQEALSASQDEFELKAARFEPAGRTESIRPGDPALIRNITIRNLANVQIDNLNFEFQNIPSHLSVSPNPASTVPTTVGPNGTVTLSYRVEALDLPSMVGTPDDISIRLRGDVAGTQQSLATFALRVYVSAQTPYLVLSPSTISSTVTIDEQQIVTFTIRNTGGAAAENVQLSIPCLPNPGCGLPVGSINCLPTEDNCPSGLWVSSTSDINIGMIEPGAERQVQLALTPRAGIALVNHHPVIGVTSSNAQGRTLNTNFRVVSNEMGSIQVRVEDELTYYGDNDEPDAGGPLLSGATVTLLDRIDGSTVATNVTDETGIVEFDEIREASYTLRVTAPGHNPFQTIVDILPDEQTLATAFLQSSQVTYTWTVVPIDIEDQYNIIIEAIFQTYVPVPVVTLNPTLVDLDLAPGESIQVNYEIRNWGLLGAQGGELIFNAPPGYEITALTTDIGDIPGTMAGVPPIPITVPVTITRTAARGAFDCASSVASGLRWFIICNEPVYYWVPTYYRFPVDCPGSPPVGGCPPGVCGGGGGGGGGGSYNPPPGYSLPTTCQPPPPQPEECPPCQKCECSTGGTSGGGGPGPGGTGGDNGGGAGDNEAGDNETHPVRLATGEWFDRFTDLRIRGRGFDFQWRRNYRSKIGPNSMQGNGWDFSYNLWIERSGTNIVFHNGDGRADVFAVQPDNTWAKDEFFHDFRRNADGTYTCLMPDRSMMDFHAFVPGDLKSGKVSQITDRNGNAMRFEYDDAGRLDEIIDTLDRSILVAYNTEGYIESVTDFIGRSVTYDYYTDGDADGSTGDLKSVTSPAVLDTPNGNDFPEGKTSVYTYSTGFDDERLNHNLTSITDPKGQTFVRNIYATTTDPEERNYDRVVRQVWGDDGDNIDLVYIPMVPTAENSQAILRTIVNDRVGNVTEYDFDIRNRLVRKREFTGRANPDQPTTTGSNRPANKLRPDDPPFFQTSFGYNNDSRIVRINFPNGDIKRYVYETAMNPDVARQARGNLREVRHQRGSNPAVSDQEEIVRTYVYDTDLGGCCGFNFVTEARDGKNNLTVNSYDPNGNLEQTVHRITSIVENWEYNEFGQPKAYTHPDNGSGHRRRDEFHYYESGPQRGYLEEMIVDVGGFELTTRYEYDAVGNVLRVVDPRGNDRMFTINELDQVVRQLSEQIDGVRYERLMWYDANDNMVRLDVENRDDQGQLDTANPYFTTLHEHETLNLSTRTCQEKGVADVLPNETSCAGLELSQFVVTEYEYDANRNRTMVVFGEAAKGAQLDNVIAYRYDERDFLYRQIRGFGGATPSTEQQDYDGNGNLIRKLEGLEGGAHTTTRQYDILNRLRGSIDPMGNVTTLQYDSNSNLIHELIEGEMTDIVGSANNVRLSETAFVYDDEDRQTRVERAFFDTASQQPIGDGLAVTQTIYTPNSMVEQVINDNSHATTTTYDTANRRNIVTDAKGNKIAYTYDENSNITRMTETEKHDLPGRPDEVFITDFIYDPLNRRTHVITGVTVVDNTNRSFYDSRNNRSRTLDALNHEVLYQYDGLNRLIRTIRDMDGEGLGSADPTAHAGGPDPEVTSIVTEQGWDDSSRLVTQTDDNGNTTTYVYDGLNRKTAEVFADCTQTVFVFDSHDTNISWTDGNENEVTQFFDARDRLVQRGVVPGPGVSHDTTFEVYKYDGLSRLVWGEDNDSLVTRAYDSLSHVTLESQTLHDDPNLVWPSAVVATMHDGVGNMLELGYPSGRKIVTTYDEVERKKTIVDSTDSDNPETIAEYWYVGPSRVSRRDNGNGTRSQWMYDGITGIANLINDFGVKQIVRTSHFGITDNSTVDNRAYTWDRVGNKTQDRDDRVGGPLLSTSYDYDNCYRLINSAKVGPVGPVGTIQYTLDGVANRTEVSGGLDAGLYMMDDTLCEPADFQVNQYSAINVEGRTYDANGNLIRRSIPDLSDLYFDFRNQLVLVANDSANSHRFKYDVFARRICEIPPNLPARQVVFSADWQELETIEAGGLHLSSETYGLYIDDCIMHTLGPERYYVHRDALFSSIGLTSDLGICVERYSYGDFGRVEFSDANGVSVQSSAFGNRGLFTGRWADAELDLVNYRTRYYEPRSGEFLSRDWLGTWGDNGALGSARAYVYANPVTFVDPSGAIVLKCRRPTRIQPMLDRCLKACDLLHEWIMTDTYEAGMGAEGGGVPGGQIDLPGIPTTTNDHTGQHSQPGAKCYVMKDVDEDCVNRMIKPGQPTGRWWPWNNCNTFVSDVLSECSTKPKPPRPTLYMPPELRPCGAPGYPSCGPFGPKAPPGSNIPIYR